MDGQNGTTTQIGPFYGDLMASSSRTQDFTFVNQDGITNNICTVKLYIWSPYLTDPLVITKTVIVGPPLRADFLPNVTAGIAPQAVRFLDVSAGVIDTWHWDFGDGTTNTTRNPEHVFNYRACTPSPSRSRATTRRSRRHRYEHDLEDDHRGGPGGRELHGR